MMAIRFLVRLLRGGGVMIHTCPWCGPYTFRVGFERFTNGHPSEPICPTCEMTPGEHAYRLRILADSDAVYAEEHRAFQAQRAAERSRVA
jgi:hypothetical protein